MTSSKTAVNIRRATPGDCEALLNLWLALLQEQEELDERFRSADDAAERWRNDYGEWIRDGEQRIFIAEKGDEIAGYVSACRWFASPVYQPAKEIFIEELYVRPDGRRSGAGRALAAAVREWADELEGARLRVGVLAQNMDGRAFWEKLAARPLALTLTIELGRSASDIEREEAKNRLGF